MKEAVVLYSPGGAGHLTPMVALARLLINHGFSATVVTFNLPYRPGYADQEVSRFSSANPMIAFHVLPPVSSGDGSNHVPQALMHVVLRAQNMNFCNLLTDLSKTSSVCGIILDFFCTDALEVAKQLRIPAYFFTAFGASCTALFLDMLQFDASTNLSLKDFGETPTDFEGLPLVPASDIPTFLLDWETDSYKSFVQYFPDVTKSDGILMNTFESLEPKAISALREGHCVSSFNMPPVYCIGPLIIETREKETNDRHECLKWLDSQPKGTVVYLCCGSMGGFHPDQIKRIAIGLENSGQRFLWVVKVITDGSRKTYNNSAPEFQLDQILPDGFLDRTRDRGMVVQTWVPQIHVLHHEAVGGFVTHCGWNSVLEAITAGKSMIFWPLHSEQRLNKAVLTDHEMKLGMPIEGYDQDMVEAKEVETKVRWLMESEGGWLLKERIEVMKDKAAEALTEAGSSMKDFTQFLMDLKGQKLERTKIQ